MYKYPYGDSQQLNLDWILAKLKELEEAGLGLDLEEVSNALISLTYNTSTAYRRYDYAFRNGKLYRCLTDTTGAFDPAAWQEALIGDDLAVLTRWINAIDAAAVVDVKFDTSGTNGKLQQKYHDEYHDVVEVDYTPVQNSKRPLSSNAGYELNDAINNITSLVYWEQGTINSQGLPQDSTSRIRTDLIYGIDSTKEININITGSYVVDVAWYYNNTFINTDSYGGSRNVPVPATANNCRLLCKKTNDTTITPSEGNNISFGIVPSVINGAISSEATTRANADTALQNALNFSKTINFSTSAITSPFSGSSGNISDARFTADHRLIGYQFYTDQNQTTPTAETLIDIVTTTSSGSVNVAGSRFGTAGSVVLMFGKMT